MDKKYFVFVVCGAAEHINTLHFSLEYLKKYSENGIIVLTDTSRNEVPVVHDNIIDVTTPEAFDNHQASIYLKTGIHKFVPTGNLYCYLDSDIIALNDSVDGIFDNYVAPITFAPDHCLMNGFSPYAIRCNCLELNMKRTSSLMVALEKYDKNRTITDVKVLKKGEQLKNDLADLDKLSWPKIKTGIRYLLSYPFFKLNDEFYFDRKNKIWYSADKVPVLYEVDNKAIERDTGLSFRKKKGDWVDKEGKDIWVNECSHLKNAIENDLGVKVGKTDWQHWNGGVFLFDENSHDFMNMWHFFSTKIFSISHWRTRDQGALIATVWKYGLQNHPMLSAGWNFLADAQNNQLGYKEGDVFTTDAWKTEFKVSLAHVYHRFGDETWNVWNFIKKR